MCWCTPELRTPFCGRPECHPPGKPEITSMAATAPPALPRPDRLTMRMPDDFDAATRDRLELAALGYLQAIGSDLFSNGMPREGQVVIYRTLAAMAADMGQMIANLPPAPPREEPPDPVPIPE